MLHSAFRIVAEQNAVHRADNLFFLDGSFKVHYDLKIVRLYEEHLKNYRDRFENDPPAYQQMKQAYAAMARNIETVMPSLPICAKYFKMLKVIQFFSHYFQTLKASAKFPILQPGINDTSRKSPSLFPSLPIHKVRKVETTITAKSMAKSLRLENQANSRAI